MPAIEDALDAWEEELKAKAKELEAIMRRPVYDGRSASLAITHVQTAVLWALESNRREVVR